MDIWGQIVLGRENSKCKGSGAEGSSRCVRNSKKARVAGEVSEGWEMK